MTPESLKNARKALGLNQSQMARQLKTARSTYLDWENGNSRIPGCAEVAVELLQQKDKWVMHNAHTKVEAMIQKGITP